MNGWMREVDYATYCPKCKNFRVLETDEPCNECLEKNINQCFIQSPYLKTTK